MRLPFPFAFLFSFPCLLFISTTNALSDQVLCIEKEKQALLDFKLSFEADPDDDPFSSWSNASDECCAWKGIECNNHTGHVVSLSTCRQVFGSSKLRPSLLELQHLTSLNLSGNIFTMRIPKFLGSLSKLTLLDLSVNGFIGEIPPQLGNLSKLQHLDLSSSIGLYAHNLQWLSRLRSLKTLNLNLLNLSKASDWVSTLKMMPTLSEFQCDSCSLPTPPLSSISHINPYTSLKVLDLSNNSVSSAFSYLINDTSNLQSLSLAYMIPDQDNLHELLDSLIRRSRYSLEMLRIGGNDLNILPFGGMKLPSLTYLEAPSNNICSSLPTILQYLPPNLTHLDLSSNLLSGTILEEHLSKLLNLTDFRLSDNNLTINFSEGWVPPFQLQILRLRSCKVGPRFPSWILTQQSLRSIDFSNSMISDVVPSAFWDFCTTKSMISGVFLEINLSHNNISGMVPDLNLTSTPTLTGWSSINLSYNAFHGPVPLYLFQAPVLDLSYNKFSSLPPLQDKLVYNIPTKINLSNNNLSGKFPNWICQTYFLMVLNLENNRFSGTFPEIIEYPVLLSALHLSNNNFSGELPLSLKNCTQLKVLEVADNKFGGVVPSWIGETTTQLVALTLRSNHFYGELPSSLCHLQSLQILDLSDNKLSGTIPACLHNFSSMVTPTSLLSTYEFDSPFMDTIDSSLVTWKGKFEELQSRNLEQRIVIDLSGNLLSGEIPIEVTALKELKSLDLSRNNLSGNIPDKIGQLKLLEVLNLSSNGLCGGIPQSLASSTFLNTLDLSNNNLSGRIPTSTQLQSFNPSSYAGNPNLCGEPLLNKCYGDEVDGESQSPPHDEDTESFDMQAFVAAVGVGFAFGFLEVLGIFHFNHQCRLAFFRLANNIGGRIVVATSLFQSKIKAKLYFRKANNRAAKM